MTRVTLRLVRREARGGRPRLSGILPAVEAAGHRDHVLVAELLQRVRGHRRTHTRGAVEDRRLVLFGKAVLRPLLEIALRHVDRAGDVSRVPFVLLADVAELHVARADQVLDLLRRRFVDSLFDVGEEVAVCRHSSSLALNAKPTCTLGNSRYARIPAWRRCLSTCFSSCTTWPSRSSSVGRSCSAPPSRPLSSLRHGRDRTRARCSETSSPDSTASPSFRWSPSRSKTISKRWVSRSQALRTPAWCCAGSRSPFSRSRPCIRARGRIRSRVRFARLHRDSTNSHRARRCESNSRDCISVRAARCQLRWSLGSLRFSWDKASSFPMRRAISASSSASLTSASALSTRPASSSSDTTSSSEPTSLLMASSWHFRQTTSAVPTTSAGTYTSGKEAPRTQFVVLVASVAPHLGSSSDAPFRWMSLG